MAPQQVEYLKDAIRNFIEVKSGFGNDAKKMKCVEMAFRDFDRDHSGFIDEDEFLSALVKMNIVGCTEDALELFDKFDDDMTGSISYRQFAEHLFPSSNEGKQYEESKIDERVAGDVVSRVKKRILQVAGKNAGIRSVTRVLRQMDSDGSKSLNALELKEGLLQYSVTTTPEEIRTLMKFFDRDGSGKITIEEFLRGLRGDMNRARRKLVRQAWEQLVSHCELDGPDDSLSLHELASFYDVSKQQDVIDGVITEEEAMRNFISLWDKNHDDNVDWREFLEYYKDLSAGIENDDYFELMIRNAWHLSGGTGWSENTSNIRCLVTHLDGEQEVVELKNDFGVSRDMPKSQLIQMLTSQGVKEISDVALHN